MGQSGMSRLYLTRRAYQPRTRARLRAETRIYNFYCTYMQGLHTSNTTGKRYITVPLSYIFLLTGGRYMYRKETIISPYQTACSYISDVHKWCECPTDGGTPHSERTYIA